MPWGAAVGALVGAVANSALAPDTPASASNRTAQTPEQEAALRQLIAHITGRTSATSTYGGPLSTGVTPGMRMSLAALEQQSLNGAGPGGMDEARSTLSRTMGDTASDTGDYFDKAVGNPETKRFMDEILPAITSRFRGNAAYGKDRTTAELKGASDLAGTLAGKRSEMVYNAREAAKNRSLTAASLVPGFDASKADLLYKLFGAQSGAQGLDQAALDRQYSEFVRGQKGEETNINQILAALGLNTVNTVVTPGQTGFLTAAAPGIGNAATQYAMRYLTDPNQRPYGGSNPAPAGGNGE